jgi:hypothetical protein
LRKSSVFTLFSIIIQAIVLFGRIRLKIGFVGNISAVLFSSGRQPHGKRLFVGISFTKPQKINNKPQKYRQL